MYCSKIVGDSLLRMAKIIIITQIKELEYKKILVETIYRKIIMKDLKYFLKKRKPLNNLQYNRMVYKVILLISV